MIIELTVWDTMCSVLKEDLVSGFIFQHFRQVAAYVVLGCVRGEVVALRASSAGEHKRAIGWTFR